MCRSTTLGMTGKIKINTARKHMQTCSVSIIYPGCRIQLFLVYFFLINQWKHIGASKWNPLFGWPGVGVCSGSSAELPSFWFNSYYMNLCQRVHEGPSGCPEQASVCRKSHSGTVQVLGLVHTQMLNVMGIVFFFEALLLQLPTVICMLF